jgi:uncharacterized membrane protein YadS
LGKPREAVSATKSSAIMSWADRTAVLVPGLIAASLIAVLADYLRNLPLLSVISPMMLAMLIGMTLNNAAGQPNWAKGGILFSQRRLLRLAIVLLGLQLTLAEVVTLGAMGVIILAAALASTYVFTVHVARFLRVEEKLAKLIAAGTSVCGASAVVAANAVVGGKEEDVTYAVACVTIFGTIAMFLYPFLPELLHLNCSRVRTLDRLLRSRNCPGSCSIVSTGASRGRNGHDRKTVPRHDARTAGACDGSAVPKGCA